MKRIAIIGSTGSIGTQALDVVSRNEGKYSVSALCAGRNHALFFDQVRKFRPKLAGLAEEPPYIPDDLRDIEWVFGGDAARQCAGYAETDAVLLAMVGLAGLPATLAAIDARHDVLLANKESLVAGGRFVMERARRNGVTIVPVDSEHSAIFQCLQNNPRPTRIILTASGGPFRTWTKERIREAELADALKHPNWNMGAKVTIDSATMANKALETIEAMWLFNNPYIEVLVHPQSIVHSMAEFEDGAVLAQLGTPDMRVPIAYAMAYPDRIQTGAKRVDFAQLGILSFEEPNTEKFPVFALGYSLLRESDGKRVVFNAANEVAVDALIHGRIRFREIADVVAETIARVPASDLGSVDDVFGADTAARERAREYIRGRGNSN
ncbi:MAG: 1-deoxy-D-xylulose-5-phosphate reductoisomerase [Oscillospiraceae bacterium]|jgi:1-deoxy-D-xylulose-5-phosphate reductoisomerase|nr:1-deoxy-D-xylulose-5-phosphate reductoisomerase [Oscillospiraceae bacterium]